MFNVHTNLRGHFNFFVYDKNGNLKSQETGVKNFITSTGLSYISAYSIADCFRFLSLGDGTDANTLIGNGGWGTTGLSNFINEFSYIGGRTSYGDPLTTQYANETCGFKEISNGVILSRGWRIPTGEIFFPNNYSFKELMLSPGKNFSSTSKCGSSYGYFGDASDYSAIADYYDSLGNSICNANKAFTRILHDIDVNQNDYLIITYDLTITYNTGIYETNISITNSIPGGTNWTGVFKSRANIIHHGIKLINDGIVSDNGRQQISNYYFPYEYGESFTPYWGHPLEPSIPNNFLYSYFSTDNTQFLVNQISGGAMDTGAFLPYSSTGFLLSSGLKSFISNPSDTTDSRFFNIRVPLGNAYFPNYYDYKTSNSSGPSDFAWIRNKIDTKDNILPYTPSDRYRRCRHSYQFAGINTAASGGWDFDAGGYHYPRSMVLVYIDNNGSTMYPFYDILLSGTNGVALPSIDTGSYTYDSTQSSNYFYLTNRESLTIGFISTITTV